MDAVSTNILVAVVSAAIAGGISAVFGSLLTTAALRVHIEYLREACKRIEGTATRAHQRLDDVEKRIP